MKAKTENIILGIAVLLGIGYAVNSVIAKGKEFVDKLNFRVKSFSVPTLQSGTAIVPLVVELQNPVDVGITANNLKVDISIKQKDGSFKPVGSVSHPQNISVLPNAITTVSLSPSVNLNNINPFVGQSIKDAITQIWNSNTIATFKIDYQFTAEGIKQAGSVNKDVPLPKIFG